MPIISGGTSKVCCVCDESFTEAEVMAPLMNEEGTEEKYFLVFAHPYCVRDEHAHRIPICKHWLSKGVCIYQSKCQFSHPPEKAGVKSKLRGRHGTWKRRRVYNEGRCSAVRRWMLDVIGREYLMVGGCLDIAGGKGEFSFEILNLNGVASTVFDPRPLDLYRFKRKLEFGYFHRNDVLGCYNHIPKPKEGDSALLPHHIRGFFEMFGGDDINLVSDKYPLVLQSESAFENGLALGQSIAWSKKGLIHEDEYENDTCSETDSQSVCSCQPDSTSKSLIDEHVTLRRDIYQCHESEHRHREFHEGIEISDFHVAEKLVSQCSCLVGMHPDQAAEHIVEFGLRNRKPFVLVPCCVYHKQFPHRRRSDGGLVKSYGDFIEYLLRKSPEIHALQMDFEGKNIMLYFLGDREPLADPCQAKTHVCKGIATPEMWWKLSSSVTKQGPRKEKVKHNIKSLTKDNSSPLKTPQLYSNLDDFNLDLFNEEDGN